MTYLLRPLAAAAPQAVETLLDAAFGVDRHSRTAYRIRAGMAAIDALSFGAFDGETLIASLQSWPIVLVAPGGGAHPIVLVGPIAVLPELQRGGLGRRLTAHALAAADTLGTPALVLIGDPEYYGRWFGFSADATTGWEAPGPVEQRRLLARLAPGVTLPERGMLRPRLCTAGAQSLDQSHA